MHCKVPECTGVATKRFYTVPVCQVHQEAMADEAIWFYSRKVDKRKLYESIRHLSPWKDTEVGDKHCAVVSQVKGDEATAYIIRGNRYVLSRKGAAK